MHAEMQSGFASQWLDRESGRRYVLLGRNERNVVLLSIDGGAVCSIGPEDLPSRFVPALPEGLEMRESVKPG
jgi:hypothetical protein